LTIGDEGARGATTLRGDREGTAAATFGTSAAETNPGTAVATSFRISRRDRPSRRAFRSTQSDARVRR
jgi:hypothetical protein